MLIIDLVFRCRSQISTASVTLVWVCVFCLFFLFQKVFRFQFPFSYLTNIQFVK